MSEVLRKLPRRKFLHLAAGAAALPFAPYVARAQAYPARPVRIISGFPPGGSNDLYARLIAQWLSERLGQQFFVENRAGAGGNLGTEAAANAPADGYTLLLTSSGDAWNATLYGNLRFNFMRDLEPVASVARGMDALIVHGSMPVKSVPELIAAAKANPGKITMASAGVGSAPHMCWELFRSMAGIDMLHVPYRGGGPALTDLLGGQVQAYMPTLVSCIEHIRAAKFRTLAVTAASRASVLPDIPALGEFVLGYDATLWWGIAARKGTPADILQKLNTEINAGLANPALSGRIADLGDAAFASSRQDFASVIADDTTKWGNVIRTAGIRAE
jgi:tripartite-type tricarboxylate transporter receptor subunit TctC